VTDPRDIPQLQYRPCDHCGHNHYFKLSDDDLENCPKCGGELYSIVTIVGAESKPLQKIKAWVDVFDEAAGRGNPPNSIAGCEAFIALAVIIEWSEGNLSLVQRNELAIAIDRALESVR
jgi:hypothetical protein